MVLLMKEKTFMDGKRLRVLRKSKKLTQTELGKIINVTKVSISGYESGDRTPDTDNLRRLADYFGVTSDYLLGRSDDPESTEADEKTAITKKIATDFPDADLMFHDLANMTAEDLQDVYDYIKFKKSQKGD